MTKPFYAPGPDREQRPGTIGLMTTTDYDPNVARPTKPFAIGKYVIHRKPLTRTPMTVYVIMLGNIVVGSQVSMPTAADCDTASTRERARLAAIESAKATRDANTAASEAKAKATRAKRKAANNGRAREAA